MSSMKVQDIERSARSELNKDVWRVVADRFGLAMGMVLLCSIARS